MPLEHTDAWSQILDLKDELTLKQIGDRFKVSPGEVSAAFSRTRTRWGPLPGMQPAAEDELPPEPGEEVAVAASESDLAPARPGSKDPLILAYMDLLGRRPDAEVAERAGVSVRTVASFRARHGIAGYAGPRRKAARPRKRRSKIDPHVELVGKMSDQEVAERAGVTLNAVRNYRQKHGIAAPDAGTSPPGLQAWRVVAERAGVTVRGIILARTPVEAALKAVAKGLDESSISLTHEGEVLG